MRLAHKVVWYDAPDQTIADLPTFLAHLMVCGSPADVAAVERYVPEDEFRRALQDAPAGIFTRDQVASAIWDVAGTASPSAPVSG